MFAGFTLQPVLLTLKKVCCLRCTLPVIDLSSLCHVFLKCITNIIIVCTSVKADCVCKPRYPDINNFILLEFVGSSCHFSTCVCRFLVKATLLPVLITLKKVCFPWCTPSVIDLSSLFHVFLLYRSVKAENECSRGKPPGPCRVRVTQEEGFAMRHVGGKVPICVSVLCGALDYQRYITRHNLQNKYQSTSSRSIGCWTFLLPALM